MRTGRLPIRFACCERQLWQADALREDRRLIPAQPQVGAWLLLVGIEHQDAQLPSLGSQASGTVSPYSTISAPAAASRAAPLRAPRAVAPKLSGLWPGGSTSPRHYRLTDQNRSDDNEHDGR